MYEEISCRLCLFPALNPPAMPRVLSLRYNYLFVLETIGHIARSKGMAQIAREINLDRKGLYRSLAPDGNPSFKTVFKLLDILGLRVRLEQKSA